MAQSIKLKNENYIDSTGVVHNRQLLSEILTPVILFNSASGSQSSSISLNVDDVDTFEKIDIIFGYDSMYHGFLTNTVYKKDGTFKNQYINICQFGDFAANKDEVQLRLGVYELTSTSLNLISNKTISFRQNFVGLWDSTPYIYKIIGYK